jgi:phosphomannomutase
MNYLFDVDGTLTPHRHPMDKDFRRMFGKWVSDQQQIGDKVYLVTGSDKKKTVEQIGLALWRHVSGCYQNCGNQLYVRGRLIKQSPWKISEELRLSIMEIISSSLWYGVAGENINERVGMINISTVGRECTALQRLQYLNWDKKSRERESIIKTILSSNPDLDATIGGEISIDIYPKGRDKSQVLFDIQGETFFFGDKCELGGNDYTVAKRSDFYFNVSGHEETRYLLESFINSNKNGESNEQT